MGFKGIKMICIALMMAVLFSGCEQNTADRRDEASDSNLEQIMSEKDAKIKTDCKKNIEKKESTKEPVQRHIPLDDTWGGIIQVFEVDGKTKVLTMNEKYQMQLHNVTDKKDHTYQFNFNERVEPMYYHLLSYQNEIIIHITIRKRILDSKESNSEGTMITSGNTKIQNELYIFDRMLHLKSKKDITGFDGEIALALYHNKGFIAAEDGGIYQYSLAKGKGRRISRKIRKQLKDIIISQMLVNDKQDTLVFLGDLYDLDKQDVYGVIDLKNETVKIQRTVNSFGNQLYCGRDTAYITDGEIPRKFKATGMIKCISMTDKKFFDFKVDNLESTKACLSEDGTCLLACTDILSKNHETVQGYRVRIYDFSSGKILYEGKWKKNGEIYSIFPCGKGFYLATRKELHYMKCD